MINNEQLYDLSTDPGETKNVIDEYPEILDQLRTAYDKWWIRMQRRMVNEGAYQPPENNFTEIESYLKSNSEEKFPNGHDLDNKPINFNTI